MKKYSVVVHYKGTVKLLVEAEDEKVAQTMAVAEFEDVPQMEIVANIVDVSTNSFCVTEVDEEDEDDT